MDSLHKLIKKSPKLSYSDFEDAARREIRTLGFGLGQSKTIFDRAYSDVREKLSATLAPREYKHVIEQIKLNCDFAREILDFAV
jgi:hypothetical protein